MHLRCLAGTAFFLAFMLGALADAPLAIQQPSSNIITLPAGKAKISGPTLQITTDADPNTCNWFNQTDFLTWTVNVQTTGTYHVEVTYSSDNDCKMNTLTLAAGAESVSFRPHPTGDWDTYRRVNMGDIKLDDTGHVDLTFKCTTKNSSAVMNVKLIKLIPADQVSDADDAVPAVYKIFDGVLTLKPIDADIIGTSVAIEDGGNFGAWKSTDTSFRWPIKLDAPGTYEVKWLYSLDPSNVGTKITVTVGSAAPLNVTPEATADWDDYKEVKIGEVTISKGGKMDVTVKATALGASFVMNLKQITLSLKPATP